MSIIKFFSKCICGLIICLFLMLTYVFGQNLESTVLPQRYSRKLAIGNIALLNSMKPRFTVGGIYQKSLLKSKVTVGRWGNQIIAPPRVYLHTLLTGGVKGVFEDCAVLGQLGLLYRSDEITRMIGIAFQGVLPDKGIGLVIRKEILDNAGIQVGGIFLDEFNEVGWFISVDYYKILFEDLGIR